MQRVFTALCLAPIVVVLLYALPSKWFFVFLSLVAFFSIYELIIMAGITERYLVLSLSILGLVPLYTQSLHIFLMWLLFSPVIFLVTQFLQRESIKKDNVNRDIMRGVSIMLLAEIFIVLPLFYLYLLKDVNSLFPLLLILALWASDIAAYFLGKTFGKRLLVPRISPKKTYEGLAGAVLGPMIVMGFSAKTMGIGVGESLLMGLFIGLLGQIGDVFESAGKRFCGVKDSSSLLPGHGGMLDRIDSLVFTAPFLYHYFTGIKFLTGIAV